MWYMNKMYTKMLLVYCEVELIYAEEEAETAPHAAAAGVCRWQA